MISVVYERLALVDTSILYAYVNERDRRHEIARAAFGSHPQLLWCALDVTTHETFTRLRYDVHLDAAFEGWELSRTSGMELLRFEQADEDEAIATLRKYASCRLSFHDALCAAVMLRNGIYKILTLDSDFGVLGLEVLPLPPAT